VASTFSDDRPSEWSDWRRAGFRYFSRNFFFRQRFGQKVWKVTLDAGLGCPNRDGGRGAGDGGREGTVPIFALRPGTIAKRWSAAARKWDCPLGARGCIFCDPESFSPARRLGLPSIRAQLDAGMERIGRRHGARGRGDCPDFRGHHAQNGRENGTVPLEPRFVAYFQPGSNTYGPLDLLRRLYEEAISHPAVVGLAIGTRPDCVGEAVLDLLAEFSRRTWLSLEYGLQTVHDRTLQWLGRGHCYADFVDAVTRSRRRGLEVGAHVILGLPGESAADMLATADELARLGVQSVKIHNLYAVHGTRLAELVQAGEVRLAEFDEHVRQVVDFLERLPPDCVVDRLSGDAPPEYLLGPKWCLDKSAIRRAVDAEFTRRDTWQGRKVRG
jgi:uncharacterized protein